MKLTVHVVRSKDLSSTINTAATLTCKATFHALQHKVASGYGRYTAACLFCDLQSLLRVFTKFTDFSSSLSKFTFHGLQRMVTTDILKTFMKCYLLLLFNTTKNILPENKALIKIVVIANV